jgi:hypothetical protein
MLPLHQSPELTVSLIGVPTSTNGRDQHFGPTKRSRIATDAFRYTAICWPQGRVHFTPNNVRPRQYRRLMSSDRFEK